MPTAEIIAIGTELLLGEILDTNTKYLARQLRDCGIDLFRISTIGDNLQRIAASMQECLSRADIVITTGGLGPTVDDPTREAAAQAFNTHNEFHPELWEQIRQRFLKRAQNISDNNRKQAMIPAGATVIENPVGTAPSFILHQKGKTLICLPGVPREMEFLMESAVLPWIKTHYPTALIKARVLHIAAVSESKIDEVIADLERLTNPTVGLLAHPGIVDIRITAKAATENEADGMISKVEATIRERLGDDIFGADLDDLAGCIAHLISTRDLNVILQLNGFASESFSNLAAANLTTQRGSQVNPETTDAANTGTDLMVFQCNYASSAQMCTLDLNYSFMDNQITMKREYMGAPGLREEWAVNFSLDFIRRQLLRSE